MRGFARIGVVCGLVVVAAILPSTATAAVLFDQLGSPGAEYTYSMDYPGTSNEVEAADDFTVPAGQQWTINEVDVLGEGGQFPVHIRIYTSAGALPGSMVFDEPDLTTTNGTDYHVALPKPAVLGPGTYWLSLASPAFWSWRNSTANSGSPAAWENPTGEFSLVPVEGCGKTWTARTTCYPETASEPGQAFRLGGPEPTLLPAAKPSNAFSFGAFKANKKKGTGTLTVNVPGAGSVAVSGAGLKSVTAKASAAGAVKLTLKATGKAKKKLNKKGKVKAKAKVTFTPTGGDPATQTKSVTLKKKKKKKGHSGK